MSDPFRLSGRPEAEQRRALAGMVRAEPVLMRVLEGMRQEGLPDWLLVAGALYNCVWNHLSGRPGLDGVNDIDVAYFDGSDLSYEAEDRAIKALDRRFADLPLPVQLRNQARVHLWFEKKFGQPFAPLSSSAEMLGRYASKTHAVGVRLEVDGRLDIVAPFGLDDIFSFRIVPNTALDNRATHEAKGARAKAIWPEITVFPWPAVRSP